MKKLLGIVLLTGVLAFSGCGDKDEFILTNLNNPIAAPTCTDDAYATNSNTLLTVAAGTGVLANDTPNGATLTFAGTSANGGTIVGLADGSFTYTPATNFVGVDTFTYTLGNSGGVVTCTVTGDRDGCELVLCGCGPWERRYGFVYEWVAVRDDSGSFGGGAGWKRHCR